MFWVAEQGESKQRETELLSDDDVLSIGRPFRYLFSKGGVVPSRYWALYLSQSTALVTFYYRTLGETRQRRATFTVRSNLPISPSMFVQELNKAECSRPCTDPVHALCSAQGATLSDGLTHSVILSVNRTAATLFVDGVAYTQSIFSSVDDCSLSDDEPCTLHVGQRVSTSTSDTVW